MNLIEIAMSEREYNWIKQISQMTFIIICREQSRHLQVLRERNQSLQFVALYFLQTSSIEDANVYNVYEYYFRKRGQKTIIFTNYPILRWIETTLTNRCRLEEILAVLR